MERKFLRKLCGPVYSVVCRIKYNELLYSLYTQPKMVKMIKIGRLKWLGHIARV